ncbi:Vacuolar fusion protein [Alternaria alternata]|nr:Vacuolar fusion protein [Alternaria alternata]
MVVRTTAPWFFLPCMDDLSEYSASYNEYPFFFSSHPLNDFIRTLRQRSPRCIGRCNSI